MLFLLLSILCYTCLLLIFKFIQQKNISKLQVIVINYFTAALIGATALSGNIPIQFFITQPWFPLTVLLGCLFVIFFYLVALSTQLNGIAVTSVAFRLSLIIPVVAAFILYHDKADFFKISGISLALIAIFLISKPDNSNISKLKGHAFLPLVILIGTGICDTMLNYLQREHLTESDFNSFLIVLFLAAGTAGAMLFLGSVIKKKSSIQPNALITGIILGIPNYGSVYFMILALEKSGMEPSALWPLNNIGSILLSTIAAAIIFSERLSKSGAAGIIAALISILLIALSTLKF